MLDVGSLNALSSEFRSVSCFSLGAFVAPFLFLLQLRASWISQLTSKLMKSEAPKGFLWTIKRKTGPELIFRISFNNPGNRQSSCSSINHFTVGTKQRIFVNLNSVWSRLSLFFTYCVLLSAGELRELHKPKYYMSSEQFIRSHNISKSWENSMEFGVNSPAFLMLKYFYTFI